MQLSRGGQIDHLKFEIVELLRFWEQICHGVLAFWRLETLFVLFVYLYFYFFFPSKVRSRKCLFLQSQLGWFQHHRHAGRRRLRSSGAGTERRVPTMTRNSLVLSFRKQAVQVEVMAGCCSIDVSSPLSPANRCSSKARRTKHLPWRSWRSGTSWTPGSRSTSALKSSSCRRLTLTSSCGAFTASTPLLWTRWRFFFSYSLISDQCFWKVSLLFFLYSQAVQNIQGQKVPLHVDGSLFRWGAVDDSQGPVSCQNIAHFFLSFTIFFCHSGQWRISLCFTKYEYKL